MINAVRRGLVFVVRPEVRNAIDRETAEALADAFDTFDADDTLAVAVLTGAGGTSCAGSDLKAISDPERTVRMAGEGTGPLGITRMVCAAVEGAAVAGGFERALRCDPQVAAGNVVFGVPLVDGGAFASPGSPGHSHALDLILTGCGVSGEQARMMCQALSAALTLTNELARFPRQSMGADRLSW